MSNNICPECRKIYANKPTRCVCGWYLTNENKTSFANFNCHYIVNGIQCDKLGTVSNNVRSNDWYCRDHAEKMKYPNY